MSMLEVITKALSNPSPITSQSNYPIILNPDPIFLNLKPSNDDPKDNTQLVKRVDGWKISQLDFEITKSGQKFFKSLKRKLKNPKKLDRDEFIGILNSYLGENGTRVGISVSAHPTDEDYTRVLIERLGFLMGREIVGLVLEACIVLELWDLLETLIGNGLVEHSCSSNLIYNLIEKKRSDLICLCVKHVSDLQSSDILGIFKYFLSTPENSYTTMISVRKEWESQALMALDKATAWIRVVGDDLAKEASILLMIAHDEFSDSELCLHYLLASLNLDEVILSSCLSKLNGLEMKGLIRYLGKWVKKYEKFPQAGPCPNASATLGLKACEWVPTLEAVAKCLGLLVDEHFSSLVLHPEFHDELRSLRELVGSLAAEAIVCGSVANAIENLRTDIRGSGMKIFSSRKREKSPLPS